MSEQYESFAERTWGTWLVLAQQPGYKVKKLRVLPGQSLSKQFHTHRDEYWVVLEGTGELMLDKSRVLEINYLSNQKLKRGDFIHIPKQVIHKLKNTGTEPLVIIETQTGEITEEGDIVRLD